MILSFCNNYTKLKHFDVFVLNYEVVPLFGDIEYYFKNYKITIRLHDAFNLRFRIYMTKLYK